MKLSDYLKNYRKENNLTQSDLAEKLFVSKQAISKWENDRGLPDIYTYPLLSDVLGVTIDELMGKDFVKKEVPEEVKKNKNKKTKIIIIVSLIIIFILFSLLIFGLIFDEDRMTFKKFTSQTEELLQIELPEVIKYEYLDMKDFSDNNYYPVNTGYIVFEENEELNLLEQKIHLSSEWNYVLDSDLENILPLALKMYCNGQNQMKIINTKTKEINTVPTEKGKYTFKMYCYQKQMNRLIVSTFIYEVK